MAAGIAVFRRCHTGVSLEKLTKVIRIAVAKPLTNLIVFVTAARKQNFSPLHFCSHYIVVKVLLCLSFMMSWPQLVTGCMGIIGAQILLKKIPKKIWTAGNQ